MIIALQTLIYFRQSILAIVHRFLKPYYKSLAKSLSNSGDVSDDEESEDQVFADYDDKKGVVFFPPVYIQRYAAVSDCLTDDRWCGKLRKIVEFGNHDMSFVKYMKDLPGVESILCVDIDNIPLQCTSNILSCDELNIKRDAPVKITLFQGNAADPDYRLIGCDAVVAIEMIEHMLPHDLERLIHTVFGFIKPQVAVFSTPNADFNKLFKALEVNGLRRLDHLFEWTREQFHDWCSNIVTRYPNYTVTCKGIGPGPPDTHQLGCCSQLALFVSKDYQKQQELNLNSLALVSNAPDAKELILSTMDSSDTEIPAQPISELNCSTLQVKKFSKTTQELLNENKMKSLTYTRDVIEEIRQLSKILNVNKEDNCRNEDASCIWHNINWGENAPYWNQYYRVVSEFVYPFEEKSEEITILNIISEEINKRIDMQTEDFCQSEVQNYKLEIPITILMIALKHITDDAEKVKDLLEWNGYEIKDDIVIYTRPTVEQWSTVIQAEDWAGNDDWQDSALSDVNKFYI